VGFAVRTRVAECCGGLLVIPAAPLTADLPVKSEVTGAGMMEASAAFHVVAYGVKSTPLELAPPPAALTPLTL
jgi:hypothetical protein